ncbi:MAG TPA: transcription-repair coupling factor [Terriglobia bacterium]|nr:transcription-repair coupling factor [Terriglobia bacterium]
MPHVRSVFQPIIEHAAVRAAADALAQGRSTVTLSGLTHPAKALVVAHLAIKLGRPLLVLTADNEAADRLCQATSTFLGWLDGNPEGSLSSGHSRESGNPKGGRIELSLNAASTVSVLPAFDCSPYEERSPHAEILERRAVTLWNAAQGHVRVLIAPLPAALGRFREASYYRSLALELRPGDELSLSDLTEHLGGVGYEPGEPVSNPGQYSLRGGIIDVFPPEAEWPFRIEFFGDQVESVREFDPESQRSRKPAPSTLLLPFTETMRSPRLFRALVDALRARDPEKSAGAEPSWTAEYSGPFPGWEFFAPLAEARPNSLIQLLSRSSPSDSGSGPMLQPLLVWDEPRDRVQQLSHTLEGFTAAFDGVRDMKPLRPLPSDIFFTEAEFWKAIEDAPQIGLKELSVVISQLPVASSQLSVESRDSGNAVTLSPITGHDGKLATNHEPRTTNDFVLATQPAPKYHGAVKPWIEDLKARSAKGDAVVLAAPAGKLDRLHEILSEYQVPYTSASTTTGSAPALDPRPSNPVVLTVRGNLDEGFAVPELRFLLLSDSDLFGGFAWSKPGRREKSAASSFISDLSDLKAGDYVVHVDHGIALYHGLKTLEVEGKSRDFMLLTYQDEARLYVPLERLDLIEKYRSGSEAAKPMLDRLGGATWSRTKTRVKRALRDMAEELLRLYAERKMSGGVAYGADTPWQKEFEDAFEFEETPDQLSALRDIKRDLESPEPMDRLLCGDVGYGKTELAMRAAFKTLQDGKQVAVLAPTTVLAFQHCNTFRQRMASFPVRIDMLSRFRSAAEQKKTVADAAAGKVDVLIGTHRLLSKDVTFRDLGLLIVDEEQRFGVAAKEKLKKLRSNLDVLTLSATPIPRTLHMSLGGLRDLSVIETPPLGRLAIQTVVAPFSDGLIQAAILQEMERQGQVYFVHNRVENIFSLAALIQRLVPTARIGVGHGQMGEKELERVMLKFVENQYDVLVSTAIIENGLDIPRANTMIVNHADRFGLADLYQLRGRVGRSSRRAYAYFLIPSEDSLTPVARRRLAALKEFSDLGAGFRLAALDLELRGAGNVLGAEQSGHLNAIGLDLYLKMLEQTVEELKGVAPKPDIRTTLNLGLDIKIPGDYIADESQRLRMYKRISSLSTSEERGALESELADRYGPPPDAVLTLLDYALLKSAAEQLLVQSVERKADEIWIRFHEQAPVDADRLSRFIHQRRDSSLRPDGVLRFGLKVRDGDVLGRLRNILQELHA